MNWRERAAAIVAKGRANEPPKPPLPSVSFVGSVAGVLAPPSTTPKTDMRARAKRGLALLEQNPAAQCIWIADFQADPVVAYIGVAVRGVGTFDAMFSQSAELPFLMLAVAKRCAAYISAGQLNGRPTIEAVLFKQPEHCGEQPAATFAH